MTLIIDIETACQFLEFSEVPERLQNLWHKKEQHLRLSEEEKSNSELSYFNRAGIYAEFGKIICISIGVIDESNKQIRIKSLANHNEALLLAEFVELLKKVESENAAPIIFCGHNIKEFDLPYICRRLLINRIEFPECLHLSNLKPWQINHIDTLELWRFGDYKNYTSLDLLATILEVPTSKTDIDGSDVSRVYWKENDLTRISEYCSRDIFTTALVYLRLSNRSTEDFIAVFPS